MHNQYEHVGQHLKQNMHIQDAPGKEWFLLSPDMVKKIKEAFEVFEKSLDFQSSTQ